MPHCNLCPPARSSPRRLLIQDVPCNFNPDGSINVGASAFPFFEDNSNDSTGSYFDVDNPTGSVNTYNIAAPNDPTPNGAIYGSSGSTNANPGKTFLRVNQTTAVLTVTAGGSYTGTIQDGSNNAVGITVAGSSQTLTLSGNDTYSGPTTINGSDKLVVGTSSGISSNSPVFDNGTLDLNGQNISINGLNGGGTVIDSGAAATITDHGNGGFGGSISAANISLTIAGGTQNLSGNNSYGGLTTINGGQTLQAGSATGFSPNSSVLDNGTIDLNGNSDSIGALNGNGAVTNNNTNGQTETLTVTGGGPSAALSRTALTAKTAPMATQPSPSAARAKR